MRLWADPVEVLVMRRATEARLMIEASRSGLDRGRPGRSRRRARRAIARVDRAWRRLDLAMAQYSSPRVSVLQMSARALGGRLSIRVEAAPPDRAYFSEARDDGAGRDLVSREGARASRRAD